MGRPPRTSQYNCFEFLKVRKFPGCSKSKRNCKTKSLREAHFEDGARECQLEAGRGKKMESRAMCSGAHL
jgi:hypothetical protein